MQRSIRRLLLWGIVALGIGVLIRSLQQDNTTPAHHPGTPGQAREILGSDESCMGCHGDMTGFETSHQPRLIGCTPCHLGNARAFDKDKAHADMVLVPGNQSNVYQTCGTANCHGDIALRVENSLMSSMSGVVSVNRFVFGEQDSPNGFAHIRDIGTASAADTHLRHLCASCHLGNEKTHPAPVGERSRGGGCIACHLQYNADAMASLQSYQTDKALLPRVHPAINLQVGNEHCFGCHSRSGRISTNYEGWHETTLQPDEVAGQPGFRLLEDGRVFRQMPPDVHHTAGLACIDCHSSAEVMGDGQRYAHEEDAVKMRCEHCHFSGRPPTLPYDSLDLESKKIMALRGVAGQGKRFVHGIWNVQMSESGIPFLLSKNTGKRHPLPAPAEVCSRQGAHASLSCSACHTSWAPQCVGCHTTYRPDLQAFDLLDKKKTPGKWEEHLGEFFAEAPTLGVVQHSSVSAEQVRHIQTFIPGMIMTLDKSAFTGRQQAADFHRLFAPSASHTTSAKGRSCQSCHSQPLALGYGRGRLDFVQQGRQGRWFFYPEYATDPHDGLPQDAWIGFLQEPKRRASTRSNVRPFSVAEQQRILAVGACLQCHKDQSKVMQEALRDFEGVKRGMSGRCAVPVW
ncbi:MAG TPA: hypothetical protein PK198_18025 [Saprospiraceae bacterium]|nr:hypothetical protein [Saprospiraceae bacterium]